MDATATASQVLRDKTPPAPILARAGPPCPRRSHDSPPLPAIGYTVAMLSRASDLAAAARRALAAAVAAVCLGSPAVAFARPKTDVVLLKNGDRITCEIKKLDRGLLQVSTDDIGTISIEWLKVASVTSTFIFEVETTAGSLHYGSLEPGAAGELGVVLGENRAALALYEIVRITTIEATFWDRLYGNIGLGGSYTQSSGVAQASANFLLGSRRPAFEWRTSIDATLTVQESEPDSGRVNAQAGYTRLLRNRWLVPGYVMLERNTDLGYELRATAALGVGRIVMQSNRTWLRLGAGLAANREVPVDGETITNIELNFPFAYEVFTYDYPKFDLTVGLTAFPSLSDWGRFRFNSDLTLSRELFTSDFYVAFTVYDDYDSRPPTEDASKNDVGVTFSLGWKF